MLSPYRDPARQLRDMSDEEVVLVARSGDQPATEYLLSRYRHLVECKARSYFLAGADHDDVVQEGMIGLYKAIRDYRDDRLAHFRAFADLCVTRQIITAIKMATRQKHIPLNGYLSLHYPSIDGEGDGIFLEQFADSRASDPAISLCDSRSIHALRELIERSLSVLESRVLCYYLQGKSYREISDALQCPAKAVDNALQRVKRKVTVLLPSDER
jgi:RNA polymerase sporulation-specific sigma factor